MTPPFVVSQPKLFPVTVEWAMRNGRAANRDEAPFVVGGDRIEQHERSWCIACLRADKNTSVSIVGGNAVVHGDLDHPVAIAPHTDMPLLALLFA